MSGGGAPPDPPDPLLQPPPGLPPDALAVRILDLSGGNGAEPVETITGFASIEHVNAFARRYVRDSVEICRARGADAEAARDAWFAFGEDAEVLGAGEHAWTSASELAGFFAHPARDAEERNWRVLDPRRIADAEEDDEEADPEA